MATTKPEQPPMFKCTCNASARFVPVYRFNVSGDKPAIMMGPLCPATCRCVNCGQLYVWAQPSAPGEQDGGWRRQSALDDLLELEAAGG